MDGVPPSKHLMYPENLTLGNGAYFLLAPTLVYQLTYPRSARFRSRWVLWCASLRLMGFCYMGLQLIARSFLQPSSDAVILSAQRPIVASEKLKDRAWLLSQRC